MVETTKKNKNPVLIVDDEKCICKLLSELLQQEEIKSLSAYNGKEALQIIRSEMIDLVLADYAMPGMNGLELLKQVKKIDSDLPVVIITAYADVQGAVEAMRAGAHDYMAKPFEHHEVVRVVYKALEERDIKRRLANMSNQLHKYQNLRTMMGHSIFIDHLILEVNLVAKSDFSVIILGETGTGKELVAHAIHNASSRAGYPFIPVDCGAIPTTLVESELFGYEKGAFTGAQTRKEGKFVSAEGGTLFMDEIQNLPSSSQVKLLRVLQEKKVYPIGRNKPVDVNVRLLTASNKNLEDELESNSIRRDLYYRLNEFSINIPPLRQRKDDIIYLAKRFLDITNIELNKSVKNLTESALKILLSYNWPGNVRQLKSTIRRAVLLADSIITDGHLDIKDSSPLQNEHLPTNDTFSSWSGLPFKEIIKNNTIAIERRILAQALKYTGGNKAKAARLLQIDYKTIHTKVKQLGISLNGG
ncbi:MAG: sigma-54 dependent transcriptional regulator [Candidatus Hatepunaea meridiana]|nr:sigma-54 dependent transcriptional regulator [Candidatus Hatepunaea meridiana]